ncbi:MAG TPA: TIGR02556 family CRISPR-associated protein [Exilispira sp.]|nr:TIGR02556 family CRISPR-associated protein [Exilispira sp.]
MIDAVKKIGEYSIKENNNTIEIYENPKCDYVLLVTLKEENNNFEFDKIIDEEFSKDKLSKYLFKEGNGSAGINITPTAKISQDIEEIEKEGKFKTFENKFLQWFKNYINYDKYIENIYNILEKNKEEIQSRIIEKIKGFKKQLKSIITLAIEKNNEILYIGDIEVFKEILNSESKKQYYSLYSIGTSICKNEKCFVCKEIKDEVYGFAIPFGFHTFDKPGFVAGGFDQKESWKNTPVCFDCARKLEQGKKYIEENLNFKFYGFNYFLIPKLIIGNDYFEILSIFENYKKDVKLTPGIRRQITSDEKEILELVGRQKNFFNNNLYFYFKPPGSSAERILLYIEGILPSRLRYLFEVKEKVDNIFKNYNELLNEKQPKLEFNFGILRNFFPKESENIDYTKNFLEIINNIFVGNNIEYNLVISALIRQIRKQYVEDKYPINYITLSGFLLLNYIQELDLFKNSIKDGGKLNMDQILKTEESDFDNRVEEFFTKHNEFFSNAEKKATFLNGILIQFLLNIQYREKNSTPFRTKLQGLKLNEKIIKNLLVEAQNKLEEYGKNYYKDLEMLISKYFVLTEGNWRISDDETSFYFVLGMNMAKLFKANEKEEDNESGN